MAVGALVPVVGPGSEQGQHPVGRRVPEIEGPARPQFRRFGAGLHGVEHHSGQPPVGDARVRRRCHAIHADSDPIKRVQSQSTAQRHRGACHLTPATSALRAHDAEGRSGQVRSASSGARLRDGLKHPRLVSLGSPRRIDLTDSTSATSSGA